MMKDNHLNRFKSEKREQRKKLRRIKVHGRRFAELVKNAIQKRLKTK
jgi:hypothetical protein